MRSAFWKSDWFLGLVVVVLMLFASGGDLMQSLERKAYDIGVQSSARAPSDRIAVIAIDDTSIANIGRWPWSREVHARMSDLLAGAKAKVVANTLFLFEPQIDPGYLYITKLLELAARADPVAPQSPVQGEMIALLREAESALNTDRRLAESYARAGNVLLPMLFTIDIPRGKPDRALPEFVSKNAIPTKQDEFGALPASAVYFPLENLGRATAALGHLNANPDVDGGIRTEPLVLRYFEQHFPSLSLMIAAKSLNLAPADITIRANEGVTLGRLSIGTDPALQMYTYFYKDRDGRPAFQVDSFYDVITGKIPAAKYADKIVLIGATAAGVGTTSVTPVSPAMAPVLTLAHSVSSILQEHFFVAPAWAYLAQWGVFLAIALYLVVLLPRLKAAPAALVTVMILVALVGVHFALMTTQNTARAVRARGRGARLR
jgi:serine/threonine-protein kinase